VLAQLSELMDYSLLSIIESTHDSIILANQHGNIILWNNASTKIFGFAKEEAIGQNLHLIIPDEFHEMHNKGMSKFLLTGQKKIIGKTIELNARRKDGSLFPIELSLSSWKQKDETFICGIIRDISSRKTDKKNILDLSGIIDSSPSCLKLLGKDGTVLKMNQAGINFIEADDFESVKGTNFYDMVKEEDQAAFIAFNEHICQGQEGTHIYKIIGSKGSERILETFSRAHTLENGNIAHLAITNDITIRINTQKELLQKDQALQESKRLSVIGEFAAGIAHEINNPLSIIQAKAQLLEIQLSKIFDLEDEKIEPIKKSLDSIRETISQTSDIINNLKTFSRSADFTNLEYHQLEEVINMTLKLSQRRCANAGISIFVNVDPKIHVLCTPIGLSQVLLNLIHNSFDAVEDLEEKWIKIEAITTNECLQLSLTDSGNGIDSELSRKILEPFFTTKDPGKGTGLGLSISLNSMKKMKGKMHYNEKAKNTQFILEFEHYKI
jgi:PAS domain S-box-containing protein